MAVTNAEVDRVETAAASAATLAMPNRNRRGLTIFNESAAVLYVKAGESASSTDYTVAVEPSGYLNLKGNPIYVGLVTGRLASGSGNAQVTEFYG
jgi:hypothetical protein